MYYWRLREEGIELRCHVQPGSKAEGFAGLYGDALKIRLRAPAIDGRANVACQNFLAEAFAVQRADVILLQGAASRLKRWWIKKVPRWPEDLPGPVPFSEHK